jgi:hypothetical protein
MVPIALGCCPVSDLQVELAAGPGANARTATAQLRGGFVPLLIPGLGEGVPMRLVAAGLYFSAPKVGALLRALTIEALT